MAFDDADAAQSAHTLGSERARHAPISPRRSVAVGRAAAAAAAAAVAEAEAGRATVPVATKATRATSHVSFAANLDISRKIAKLPVGLADCRSAAE